MRKRRCRDNRLLTLALECVPENLRDCQTQSGGWAWHILIWMAVALVGVKAAGLLRSTAKRLGGLSVSSVLRCPDEQFVLYLRPFAVDEVILPKPRLPFLSAMFSFRPFPARVEEELFDVTDGFRPLIAVGRRGGALLGGEAYRAYLDDSDWQAFVLDRIRRAERIVIVLKDTAGVRWEFSNILSEGAAEKTLFLLEPAARFPAEWRKLAEKILPVFIDAGLVLDSFAFKGQPIGFYFENRELVEIQNANWTTTSYRTAFSHFLAERTER